MCSSDTATERVSSAELVGVKICRQPTYGSGRRGAHLGTATDTVRGRLVAPTGPDASRCIGISPNGIRQVGGLAIDCQSALRWQCQDAPSLTLCYVMLFRRLRFMARLGFWGVDPFCSAIRRLSGFPMPGKA